MHDLQRHSCAVLSSGAVKCWGCNDEGRVIARAGLRGVWVCVGRRCAADELIFVRLATVHLEPIDLRPLLLLGWAAALRALLQALYDCFVIRLYSGFCHVTSCAIVRVGVVVCAVLGCCGVCGRCLALPSGKCLWLIAHFCFGRDEGLR